MELFKETTNDTYIFRIMGNMRIKLLCDYESHILSKNKSDNVEYITFKNGSMYIEVTNLYNFQIPYDKCYLALSYKKDQPNIECIYKYDHNDSYIPLFISQPDKTPNFEILKKYNIKPNTILYNELIIPNTQEYFECDLDDNQYYDLDHSYNYKNNKTVYPSVIFTNDDLIHLLKNKTECYDNTYIDDKDVYFTDISLSDDSLYS